MVPLPMIGYVFRRRYGSGSGCPKENRFATNADSHPITNARKQKPRKVKKTRSRKMKQLSQRWKDSSELCRDGQ